MKTYFIEPGDWEAATGESLPNDSHGIAVVALSDFERLRSALKKIVEHQKLMGGGLAQWSTTRLIAENALKEKETCEELK